MPTAPVQEKSFGRTCTARADLAERRPRGPGRARCRGCRAIHETGSAYAGTCGNLRPPPPRRSRAANLREAGSSSRTLSNGILAASPSSSCRVWPAPTRLWGERALTSGRKSARSPQAARFGRTARHGDPAWLPGRLPAHGIWSPVPPRTDRRRAPAARVGPWRAKRPERGPARFRTPCSAARLSPLHLGVVVLVSILGSRPTVALGHCTLPRCDAPVLRGGQDRERPISRPQSDYHCCAAIMTFCSVRDERLRGLSSCRENQKPRDDLGRHLGASTHLYAPGGSKTYPDG